MSLFAYRIIQVLQQNYRRREIKMSYTKIENDKKVVFIYPPRKRSFTMENPNIRAFPNSSVEFLILLYYVTFDKSTLKKNWERPARVEIMLLIYYRVAFWLFCWRPHVP